MTVVPRATEGQHASLHGWVGSTAVQPF